MKLERVYQYRTGWMGIAILWVILFHSTFEISNPLLGMIREVGYGGVDIFVFAAGMGGVLFLYERLWWVSVFQKESFTHYACISGFYADISPISSVSE